MAQLTQAAKTAGPRHSSAAPARRRRVKAGGAGKQQHAGPIAYILLIIAAAISLFPLYWTVVAASHTDTDITQPPTPLLPGSHLVENIKVVWDEVDMTTALINSTVVAGCVAISTVLFATLAGFAFAKLRFRGRNALLMIVVATMTIPPQLSVIPLYQIITKVGWFGHLQAVILPSLVAAFGVFFMRQFLSEALPIELIEAARVDGAHSLRILWHVVFPIARPAMAVLGMLVFVQAWNDFFWPLIALNQQNPTVQVALAGVGAGNHTIDHAAVVTAALVATLPLLLVFAFLGKHIVGGITAGAVKS
ncbi:carbohydrate ABC transporter permease [Actinacidiphila bryophytorum]|uniref:Cellobiose transport system permease protein n=1 Tax=Actinacidiphila bryophytorum TaxID=1436133 RepID=A0A9W4EDL1_9ACTN|nr:carbohydrate ABC transporter permease [Actinacidiphila bryophytorum]MBM9434354.1 carbohydrate ABC transporter permease [Actinacidiphila bryophytorum]MBN6547103.1 carbohydrate ABC transporter permease [Actinacidiphila bryophytorum]CAG7625106.1 Cellobiose transport system permease protein [Actinacidiphila bryophytorum]